MGIKELDASLRWHDGLSALAWGEEGIGYKCLFVEDAMSLNARIALFFNHLHPMFF